MALLSSRTIKPLAGAVAAALVVGLVSAPSADAAGSGTPVPLTTKTSYQLSRLRVVGVSAGYGVIYNSVGNNSIYRAMPNGTGLHFVAKGAATAVAKGEVFYYSFSGSTGARRYLDLSNGHTGLAPTGATNAWDAPAAHGGLHLSRLTDGWHMFFEANTGGSTDLGVLLHVPNQDNINFTVLSGDDGFAVVAAPYTGPASLTPIVEYNSTYGAHNYVRLQTGSDDPEFTCSTLTSSALGCSDEGHIVRVDIDRSVAPQVTPVTSEVADVAATQDYTAYTTYDSTDDDGEVPACPCSLHTIPVGATAATATRSHLPYPGLAAWDNDNFFYTSPSPSTPAGLFRSISASSTQHRVATAPHRSLYAQAVTLGPGRAAWADDSVVGDALSARAVRGSKGHVVLGATTKIAGGLPDDVSVSGRRIAYSQDGTSGPIRMRGPSKTITVGHGTVRTISGTRVLYQASGSAGHWIVYNLATKKKYDATSKLGVSGDSWPALWGNYLAYFKTNGSLWRINLDGSAAKVELAAPVTHADGGMVQMWGDWVAWRADRTPGYESVLRARNTRTLAPAHALGDAFDVDASSAAGVVVSYGENKYKLVSWSSASLVTAISTSDTGTPAVDGQLIAYVNSAGTPVVTALTTHVVNRPRSLGNAVAPKAVTHGHQWALDLVTSAPLTKCSVRIIHSGTVVKTVACTKSARKVGEVVAKWNATGAGKTYQWKIIASNSDGHLLAANGSKAATTGIIHVH